ncbi:MAG: RNA polymerase sigma factor [Planctomycetota bacterium]
MQIQAAATITTAAATAPAPRERRGPRGGERWRAALAEAHRALRQFGDEVTCRQRDDLVQDAALALWEFQRVRGDARRPQALVRTIAMRARWKALRAAYDRTQVLAEAALGAAVPGADGRRGGESPHDALDRLCPSRGDDDERGARAQLRLLVEGRRVPCDWLLDRLDALLRRLRPANRQLVLDFYAGESCAELGARLGLSEDAVRVRLHRSRAQLRRWLEDRARTAGSFDT